MVGKVPDFKHKGHTSYDLKVITRFITQVMTRQCKVPLSPPPISVPMYLARLLQRYFENIIENSVLTSFYSKLSGIISHLGALRRVICHMSYVTSCIGQQKNSPKKLHIFFILCIHRNILYFMVFNLSSTWAFHLWFVCLLCFLSKRFCRPSPPLPWAGGIAGRFVTFYKPSKSRKNGGSFFRKGLWGDGGMPHVLSVDLKNIAAFSHNIAEICTLSMFSFQLVLIWLLKQTAIFMGATSIGPPYEAWEGQQWSSRCSGHILFRNVVVRNILPLAFGSHFDRLSRCWARATPGEIPHRFWTFQFAIFGASFMSLDLMVVFFEFHVPLCPRSPSSTPSIPLHPQKFWDHGRTNVVVGVGCGSWGRERGGGRLPF